MKPNPYHTDNLERWGKGHNRPLKKEIIDAAKAFKEILLYAIIPRTAKPAPPEDPPDIPHSRKNVDKETLIQCKNIYDEAEAVHKYLDEKARATFTVISFLAPFLIGAITFLMAKSNQDGAIKYVAIAFDSVAFIFLILGFIATVRALAVQGREILFLDSVIDPNIPSIRIYNRTRHAKGLLYCASVNTALNTHIAHCVRSAHVLTAIAVVIAAFSSIPALVLLSNQKETISKTEIASPILLKIEQIQSLNESIKDIKSELKNINATINTRQQFEEINRRFDMMDSKINSINETNK